MTLHVMKNATACVSETLVVLLACVLGLSLVTAPAVGQSKSGGALSEDEVNNVETSKLTAASRHLGQVTTGASQGPVLRPVHLDEAGREPAALNRIVSIHLEGAAVEEALRRIAKKADLEFAYLRHTISVEKSVTLNAEQVSVGEVLREVMNGTGLKVFFMPGTDLIWVKKREAKMRSAGLQLEPVRLQSRAAAPVAPPVQTGTITGTVTDSTTGELLPGVNVVIAGTQRGAATDAEGRFTISDLEPGTYDLVASFVGYTTKRVDGITVTADDTTVVTIALSRTQLGLDAVVVVGYGTQLRENVTGAVSSVSLEQVESIPVTGVTEAMIGKVAGVRVSTVTGVPGGGVDIQIRGVGSIGAGNDPLYVVDGFPIPDTPGQRTNPLNSIPPAQIASIEVLKDASATAIYGSRGANGVILITTKEGRGGGLQVQFNNSIGLQSVRERGMVDVLNARQFAQFKKQRISDRIRFFENREPRPEDIPEMYRNPEQYGEGTDWTDLVLRPAIRHNHSISISGGNETIKSRVSASYLYQQGTIIDTGYKRYALRANVGATLSDNLRVALRIAPSLEQQQLTSTDGAGGRHGVYASSFLVNPIQSPRSADGTLTKVVDGPGVLPFANPVFKAKNVDDNLERARVLANANVQYDLMPGLTFESSFNLSWMSTRHKRFKPTTVTYGFSYPPQEADGMYNTTKSVTWVNENTLNYNTNIGGHSLQALVGFTLEEGSAEMGRFDATGYPDNEIPTFNAASVIGGSTNLSEWSLMSALARVNYNYKGKYLLTGTIRRDGSSRFGSANRWGTFPSFSVGWRLSSEPFMDDNQLFNNLLLRVGYGISGNFRIGNYRHLGRLSKTDYVVSGQQISGRSITTLGNSSLGWEEVRQLNIGLDVGMLDNRLRITADYYRKVSSDMLLDIETPLTSGFSRALDNRGEVTNQGVEFSINAVPVSTSSWNWGINLNMSRNVNKVTNLDSPILSPAGAPHHITEVGYPIGMFYGFNVEGFYESEEEIEEYIPNGNAIPGAFRYTDVNNDGQITPVVDFVRIGNPYPEFTWGLTSTLEYRNVDFSFTVTGSHGNEMLQTGYEDFFNLDGVFNVSTGAINRWRSPEDPGSGRAPRAISTVIHRHSFSAWIVDASNVWVRNITLGYTMTPEQYDFLNTFATQEVRIYVTVKNAWISNTNLQNPDASLHPDNPLLPGQTRNLNYPISRIFTLGINMRF